MQEYSQGVPAFFIVTRIYSFAGSLLVRLLEKVTQKSRKSRTYFFGCASARNLGGNLV